MLNQLSNLEFFHLLYSYYHTSDKQVGHYYKLCNLVYQINKHHCIQSHCGDRFTNLHLQIPEFSLGLTSSFNIAGSLYRLNQNKSSSRQWFTKIKVNNKQILALKIIYLGCRLSGHLKSESTQYFLRFTTKKRDSFHVLPMFNS